MIEWRDINGYEGYYEVSNTGEIRSVDRLIESITGKVYHRKPRIINQRVNKGGYKSVVLSKDGKSKTHLVHRLVASAYISNPNNYPQINHKDEDRQNNCVENLEWCDSKYNCNYGTHKEKLSNMFINSPIYSKSVLQYKDDVLIKKWVSMKECERNGFDHSAISKCCQGKQIAHKGYRWCYGD